MDSKSISFIKATINIAMVILLTIAFCIIIDLREQNAKLDKINYELTISLDTQEDVIDKLLQNNKDLKSNITHLKEINNKVQDDNKLLESQVQELLAQVDKLKENITKLEEEKGNEKDESIITPSTKDFKSYLPYNTITDKSSKQWKLQQQATTNKEGIRCIDGIPMIAIGTGWGLSVGDIALITCDNGNSFLAIIGDIKADIHTDAENKTTIASGCRCEFIVELSKLNPRVKITGNVAILSKYSGYVINIEKNK